MHSQYLFLFILFFSLQKSFSQSKTFSVSIFYEINETKPSDFKKLDSLYDPLLDNISFVRIIGHADFLNDDRSNVVLSQRRADAIKNYLLQKPGRKVYIRECKGVGETGSKDNQSTFGEPSQRRVDVFITLQNGEKIVKPGLSKKPVETQKGEKKPKQDLSKNIKELKKGESLAVEGLLFIPGRHVALDSSMPVLEALVATLEENPNLKIEIEGHICCEVDNVDGYDYDNLDRKLSENRAKAVYEYLIKNGIDASRLTYKGYGHSKPKIFPETNPYEEQMNRRVEIKVLDF